MTLPRLERARQAAEPGRRPAPVWAAVAGIALSATLFALALPPADVAPLGWIALAPLLAGVRGRGWAGGFGAALVMLLLAGGLTHSGLLYAADPGAAQIEGASAEWNYLGFAIFALAVGGCAAVVALSPPALRPGALGLLGLAGLAVLLEALLLIYLPAHVALTQYRHPWILALASVGGIWAASFVVWWVNLALADAVAARLAGQPTPGQTWLAAGLAGAMVAGAALTPAAAPPEGPGVVTVAALQTADERYETIAAYARAAGTAGARLLVLPELMGTTHAPGGDAAPLIALAASEGVPPFVTSFQDAAKPMKHNAAALFCASGESARYWKRKPFAGESLIHAAGTEPRAAPLSPASGALVVGLNICFDSCFPHVMRDTARLPGVALIALPTLDPRGPSATIQAIHAAYTPFRSAELGLPIVRAEWTAHSHVTDASGRIVAERAPGDDGLLIARVASGKRWTLYTALGDWWLGVCALLVGWAVRSRGYRPEQASPASLEDGGSPS